MPPQDPYAGFGPPVKPPAAQADPYAAFGAPVTPPKPVANTNAAPAQPSLIQVLTQPTDKTDKEYMGYTGPAGVAGATIHGLNNVAEATKNAVSGAWDALKTPQGIAENVAWLGGPIGLAAERTGKGLWDAYKQIPQIPAAVHDIAHSSDPLTYIANAAQDTAAQGAGQALVAMGTEGLGKDINAAARPIKANLVDGVYSKPGSQVAASLRASSRFDVPAAAANAHEAISEGLADRGITAADFKGRNGPQALQSGIDNAIDINEARAKSVIDPIRSEVVDPKVLADNPELAARFGDRSKITYGDIDAERIKMNKELRRANFYSKDPSAQYAAADPLANTEVAVNQARDAVYGKAQDVTGYDLRPLKLTESNLIKLSDLAETTKNSLSANAAQTETASRLAKAVTAAKKAISIQKNPASSLASLANSPETLDLNGFNSNMQKAFAGVKASPAARTVTFPKYDLNLTPPPPGEVGPSPMQNILDFSKEAHPEPYPTRLPESSIRQKLLSAAAAAQPDVAELPQPLRDMGVGQPTPAPEIPQPLRVAADIGEWRPPPELGAFSGSADVGAKARAALEEKTGPLTRNAERRAVPRVNQQADDALFTQAAKELGDGASTDDVVKRMQELKSSAQGGHAGNGVASVEELSRAGKNYVVDAHGKLTYHGKSFAPEETPARGAHVTVLPDGSLRVNAGDLTPSMARALKEGLIK